jgi:uncharacterized membrane protein
MVLAEESQNLLDLLEEAFSEEISSRTNVGPMGIVLALAFGAAGALSFTSAAPAVLIGVAVAVALMPPLVVFGLLLGAGYYYWQY